jgi:hypothetical protein
VFFGGNVTHHGWLGGGKKGGGVKGEGEDDCESHTHAQYTSMIKYSTHILKSHIKNQKVQIIICIHGNQEPNQRTRLELVRDVELVGVEEEEDEVGPLREPPADVGEVIPIYI